ncbi:MAG: GTP cyclohydrolase I [Sphaerochaetaceae bacterium]
MNEAWIIAIWRKILTEIGENPARPGLRETPERISRAYEEIFRGYHAPPPKVTCFNDELPRGLIMDKGYFFSMCEHHVLPFFGHYYFGYIPDPEGSYLGASKIGRVVDYFSARLLTQERLVKNVLDHIENAVNPLGSILLMSGRHLCKEMRGLKKWNSPFEVIEARGILLENKDGCKDEFMSRLASRI